MLKDVVANTHTALQCFVDPRPEAISTAETFDVPLFVSIKHMLREGSKPDGAIVCTPNHTHVALGRQSLEAVELIGTAAKSERKLLVGHHRRFNSYVVSAKKALTREIIGRPVAISGLWVIRKADFYFDPTTAWRSVAGEGGPISINLVHDIYILQYWLRPITRVHAEKTISPRTYEVEEGAAILFRFASGVVRTFILSDNCPSEHNFESGTRENPCIPQGRKDFCRIFGTEGRLSLGDMKVSRYDAGIDQSWLDPLHTVELSVGNTVPFDDQLSHFVDVIKGSAEPKCTGKEGLRALIVCDAVKQAMATGSSVDIET